MATRRNPYDVTEQSPETDYGQTDSYYNGGSMYPAPGGEAPQGGQPPAQQVGAVPPPPSAVGPVGTPAAAIPTGQSINQALWHTGGYAAPAAWNVGNYGATPGGYDDAKWMDPNYLTPKYAVGKLYQSGKLAGTPLEEIVKQIQAAYPGTGWNGKDLLTNFPGIGNVDFIRDFGLTSASENGLAWQPESENAGPEAAISSLFSGVQLPQGGGQQAPSPDGGAPAANNELMTILRSLISGGGNQDILNRRVESARTHLDSDRQSQTDYLLAKLADQGLIGSGPVQSSLAGLESDLGANFGDEVNQIYADESANADSRMMTALSLMSGLSTADQNRALEWFKANTDAGQGQQRIDLDQSLGLGNLALGNARLGADYSLGLGNLQSADIGSLIELINGMIRGAGQSADGYV